MNDDEWERDYDKSNWFVDADGMLWLHSKVDSDRLWESNRNHLPEEDEIVPRLRNYIEHGGPAAGPADWAQFSLALEMAHIEQTRLFRIREERFRRLSRKDKWQKLGF